MKKLLLHSCCAPCFVSVIDTLLSSEFKNDEITVYFYNPNIHPFEEYQKRLLEQQRICMIYNVSFLPAPYEPEKYNIAISGFENEPEGKNSKRCEKCFYLRLLETSLYAKKHNFLKVCTTLTVSPHKNSSVINKILSETAGDRALIKDFKKKDGFLKSIRLSNKYSIYRQNYCGCTPLQKDSTLD